MPCNLNFNQCNFGLYYPRPIFNCENRVLGLLNQSGTVVVNPT